MFLFFSSLRRWRRLLPCSCFFLLQLRHAQMMRTHISSSRRAPPPAKMLTMIQKSKPKSLRGTELSPVAPVPVTKCHEISNKQVDHKKQKNKILTASCIILYRPMFNHETVLKMHSTSQSFGHTPNYLNNLLI